MSYPKTINNLIESFKRLPSVGEKTAERMAIATMKLDEKTLETFSSAIMDIKNIKTCSKCNNYSDEAICEICADDKRNSKILCVVEEAKNINLFEKTKSFNGKYYVLNGLISPLDGVNPSDINLDLLFKRVKDENIDEIILAVKPSIEGETTALYISKVLENNNVIISKIASGIPMGVDIDYMDSITIEMALEQRKKV